MERLAELANQTPEALKAALENQLRENEAMQRELNRLTQNALDRAEAALNQASQQEQDAAKQQQAKSEQDKGLTEQAKKIAAEIGFELQDLKTVGGSDGNFTAAIAPTLDGLGVDGKGGHTFHEQLYVSSLVPRVRLMLGLFETLG